MHFEFWGNLSKFQAKTKKKPQGGDLVTETGNWGIYAAFRVGMYVWGYLFIMARAHVSREGGHLSGQSAGLAVQSQVMTASQICSWCS